MIFSVEINRSTSVLGCDSPSGAFPVKHEFLQYKNNMEKFKNSTK